MCDRNDDLLATIRSIFSYPERDEFKVAQTQPVPPPKGEESDVTQ